MLTYTNSYIHIYIHVRFSHWMADFVCNIILYASEFIFFLSTESEKEWRRLIYTFVCTVAYHLNAASLIINSLNYLETSDKSQNATATQ